MILQVPLQYIHLLEEGARTIIVRVEPDPLGGPVWRGTLSWEGLKNRLFAIAGGKTRRGVYDMLDGYLRSQWPPSRRIVRCRGNTLWLKPV